LISDLIHTFRGNNNEISLDLKTDTVWVNLDTAIPLGLIINEIITNSLKHGTKGVITARFEEMTNQNLKLIIGDNGVGSKNITEEKKEPTLGIMLINSLVEQLDGTIRQLKDEPGTVYEMIFKQVESNA
jgi:two-component sensor histidine kinase